MEQLLLSSDKPGTKPQKISPKKLALISAYLTPLLVVAFIYATVGEKFHEKGFVDSVVLRPSGADKYYELEPIANIKKRSIFIRANDGSKIHAWLFKVPATDKITIVSHGNAGNLANRFYLAKALAHAGSSVLVYDYRGFGLSTGKPTVAGILEDGLAVYDYTVRTLGFPANKIILYGESVGTGVTSFIASKEKCAGVILQSGFESLPAMGRQIFIFLNCYPESVIPEPHLDNLTAIKSIHAPILLLHGQRDRIIPFEHSQQLFANANDPKEIVLLPDCGHNDMGVQNSQQFQDAIDNFVSKLK